jgi:hypothetical protein
MTKFEKICDEVAALSMQAKREAKIMQISPYIRMKQLIGFHQHGCKTANCRICVYRSKLSKSKRILKTCAVIGEFVDKEAAVLNTTTCNFFAKR